MVISEVRRTAAFVVALVLSACTGSRATVRSASEFPPLVTLDGTAVTLEEVVAAHDAVVLVWWSATCPCVRRYEARMAALRDRHPPEKTAVFAVSSNADDDPATIRRIAAERTLTVPILRDPGGRVASALGVRSTPTTVVLDRAGAVSFVGWIDNERELGEADRVPYVEHVLDALVAGRHDFAARSPVYGCPITRSLAEPLPECCRATAATP